MEELTLPYYLKVFNLILLFFIFLLIFAFYLILNIQIIVKNDKIEIKEGETINTVIKNNLINLNTLQKFVFKSYFKLKSNLNNKIIHFGNFHVGYNLSFIDFINIITEPSNILNKITIIEGWSERELNNELSKYFTDIKKINYEDILADTYYFNENQKFEKFYENLKKFKKNYILKFKNNIFFNYFNEEDLIIIGSLIEKEGLDYMDKKKIYSVIINRLNINMKLQIDATVIYSITDGKYNLERNLTFNDLKYNHPFNTYKIHGLPPKPISFVGTKTVDLMLENYESDYLFYFFDKSINRHIFSKNYANHKLKLNEYRNKK